MHIDNPMFTISFLFAFFVTLVYMFTEHHQHPIQTEVWGEGIRRQQLHITLRVTIIALVSAGHIRDLSNSLDVLQEEIIFPPRRLDLDVRHPGAPDMRIMAPL